MFTGLESGLGLDIVLWLQANSNPLLDGLAIAMHHAGQVLVYMVLLAFIYWAVDRAFGVRLLLAVMAATALTEILKALFHTPRPHTAFPDLVTPLVEQTGYGMPSGHTLIALVAWGLMAWHFRRRWLTILAVVVVAVMGWARMHAGVHYPQDVAGGLLFGGLLLWAFIRLDAPLAARWAGLGSLLRIGVVILAAAATVLLSGASEAGLTVGGLSLGVGLGLLSQDRVAPFALRPERGRRGLNFVLGLALTLVVYLALSALLKELAPEAVWRVVRYGLLGLVVSLGWPWLSLRAGLTVPRPAG